MSTTSAINLCHGLSVIAGVVDTGEQFIAGDSDSGDKFIAGVNDTGEQFIAGVPLISLCSTCQREKV